VVELVALDVQPALEHVALHLLHALADNNRDADLHDLLEALNVGDQVVIEVVTLECVPEVGVAGAGKLLVENAQVLHGFGESAGGGCDAILRGHNSVRGQKGEAQAEVGRGEDCEGFDEDVGDGLVAGEVGVELVSVRRILSARVFRVCFGSLVRA
jgi:hypothetical protein